MGRPPTAIGLRERLGYRFDRFMERGTIALIAGLFVVSLLIIAGVVLALVVLGGTEGRSVAELLWMAMLRTLDPGTMGGDQGSVVFVLGMLAVTFGGIFVISTLIGILNTGLQDRLAALRAGRSRVLERDHVVVLGWSQQVFPVVAQLAEAGAGRGRTAIVVLAERERVEMEAALRERVAVPRRVRVVCRSGRPTSPTDLQIANPDEARAVVVLRPDSGDPDPEVLKTILALTGRPDRRAEPYRIVAEVRDRPSADIARLIAGDEVRLLLADELVARIVAQSCRQSGLSAVYLDLLDFAGQEFHLARFPELDGVAFADAASRLRGAIAVGIAGAAGTRLCPPPDTVLAADDRLVVLAEHRDAARLAREPADVDAGAIAPPTTEPLAPERVLVLGWNELAPSVVRELDAYVAPGSELLAVSGRAPVETEVAALGGLRNLRVAARSAATTSRAVLDELDVPSFDHVIVLCEATDGDPERADARTILTLLHLRDIGAHATRRFSIVSEMLDERNRELAEVTRADDFIVSSRMLSLLLAQIAETPELADVFRELFDAEGAEIYLRDAAEYVLPGHETGFATVAAAARARGEIALGYRAAARAGDPGASFGVVLNPPEDTRRAYGPGDRVIVLAER